MMTRSKTANVNNATVNATVNVPTVVAVKNDDSTVVYPTMFDRWRLPL